MKKILLLFALFLLLGHEYAYSQLEEPEVIEAPRRNSSNENKIYTHGIGLDIMLSDFGLGVGFEYGLELSKYFNVHFSTGITGLSHSSELTYFDYYYYVQSTHHKYNQVIAFPLQLGIKYKLNINRLSSVSRPFIKIRGGTVFTLIKPAFRDNNNNGYRDPFVNSDGYVITTEKYIEYDYSIFQGWTNVKTNWGIGGELAIGMDFGRNFARISNIQIGYTLYYFERSIQILEPFRPVIENGRIIFDSDNVLQVENFNEATHLFYSPIFKLSFGWLW